MFKLNLKEIPQEGRSFYFTRESGEIAGELRDLIGDRSFTIDFFIRPVGNVYELRGDLRTGVEQVCAKCGWDLQLPVEKKFQEYLLAEGEQPRGSRSTHGNQSLDLESDGPNYTFYQGDHFKVGEFFHELIALNEAAYPSCGKSDCEHLLEAERILQSMSSAEAPTKAVKLNPFAVLKDFKANKQ